MPEPDYEYHGLMAEAWDVLRGDTSGWPDRLFYLDLIRRHGQPVLDVGCGTGRLLLDYLEQGIDIDGVDYSPEMLARCRRQAAERSLTPTLYEQPVEALALPRCYRTILVPSSSIQLLTAPGLVNRALGRLVEHLLPGGLLAASVMTLWEEGDPLESEWEAEATRPDGVTFRRSARSRFDPEIMCEHTEDLYQKVVGGVVVAEELHRKLRATRSYTQVEARYLFERAGLVDVRVLHEFTPEPARPEDTLFVVTGCREDAPRIEDDDDG